eukprot:scaffold733_cov267-Pinguiococcus_pyrenoidosus.AAC.4
MSPGRLWKPTAHLFEERQVHREVKVHGGAEARLASAAPANCRRCAAATKASSATWPSPASKASRNTAAHVAVLTCGVNVRMMLRSCGKSKPVPDLPAPPGGAVVASGAWSAVSNISRSVALRRACSC